MTRRQDDQNPIPEFAPRSAAPAARPGKFSAVGWEFLDVARAATGGVFAILKDPAGGYLLADRDSLVSTVNSFTAAVADVPAAALEKVEAAEGRQSSLRDPYIRRNFSH